MANKTVLFDKHVEADAKIVDLSIGGINAAFAPNIL
jgi:hypothetical protein